MEWACVTCGSQYWAVFDDQAPAAWGSHVRRLAESGVTDRATDVVRPPWQPSPHCGPRIAQAPPANPPVRCAVETDSSRRLDAAIDSGRLLRADPAGPPVLERVRRHGPVLPDTGTARAMAVQADRSADALGDMFRTMRSGGTLNLDLADQICRDATVRLTEDLDLFAMLGVTPPPGDYPSRHSLHVSMLALAIATTLRYDAQCLYELGLGCLLHDIGMLCIDPDVSRTPGPLSDEQWRLVVSHPVALLDRLQGRMPQIPPLARVVAYQMHERCDGSGYPRGRSADQIHPLAKVAAVADCFVALISERPHRPAMIPYHAMKLVLREICEGKFDQSAVRGLLETVSVFPLGSFVVLNDGRPGTVIRSNGSRYDRPVIAAFDPKSPQSQAAIVNLVEESSLRVVRAIDSWPEGSA